MDRLMFERFLATMAFNEKHVRCSLLRAIVSLNVSMTADQALSRYPQMTNYGDLSYLLRNNYEAAMRLLILQAKKVSMRDLRLYDEQALIGNSKPYASEKKVAQVGTLCSSIPRTLKDHLHPDEPRSLSSVLARFIWCRTSMRTTRRWHVLYVSGPFHAHISVTSPGFHIGEQSLPTSRCDSATICVPRGVQGGPNSPHPGWWQCRGAVFLLANQRFCDLLPLEERVLPTPGLRAVGGTVDRSCTSVCECVGGQCCMCLSHYACLALIANVVCRGRQLRCAASDFWFINSCAVRHMSTASSYKCCMSSHGADRQALQSRRSSGSTFLARRDVQCN